MAAKQPEFSLAAEDFPALPLKGLSLVNVFFGVIKLWHPASAEMDKQDQHNQDMYQVLPLNLFRTI